MRALLTIKAVFVAGALTTSIASAADFSKNSQANSWNLPTESKARFSGKVVDLLCELTGDCPENCGGGTRQLGVLRSADNALVPVMKNIQPAFNGAIEDLLPYCNAAVDVDGLLIGDETEQNVQYYQVQLIRRQGEETFNKTELWTKKWDEAHPEQAKKKGPWFRKDPVIQEQIAENGYFGIGKEADQKYIEENF